MEDHPRRLDVRTGLWQCKSEEAAWIKGAERQNQWALLTPAVGRPMTEPFLAFLYTSCADG